MQPNQAKLSDVFAGTKQYVIPFFQRDYSWDEREWETLWKDIWEVVEAKHDGNITHFIGPFIFIPRSEPAKHIPEYIVIDGQQRLVTITLILCVLRDRASKLGLNNFADSIETNTLLFKDREGNNQQKIIPRMNDRETINRIIHTINLPLDVDSKITKAYKFFYQKVKKHTETILDSAEISELFVSDYRKVLDEIYEVIVNRLKMITITLSPDDNPSKIYESLNFKNDPLSDADLIRNYIFMQIPVDKQDQFNTNTWQSFENKFIEKVQDKSKISETLEDFYYRYLMAKKGYFQRNRLYVEFMDWVDSFVSKNSLDVLINDLKHFGNNFLKIENADVLDSQLKAALTRFNQLKTDTAIPLLLSLFDKYDQNSIDLSELLNILKLVESFLIRRSILRLRTRGYSLDFSEAILHSQNYDTLAKFLITKDFPKDAQVEAELLKFPIYKHERAKASLILKEIENLRGHKEKVNTEDLTIEHIMPQTRTSEWERMLGEKAREVHEKYLHTIGNLTLTGYNSETSNKPFEEKKKIYTESNLILNREIASQSKWSEEEITNRSKELAKIIVETWTRPDLPETSKTPIKKLENKISKSSSLFDHED